MKFLNKLIEISEVYDGLSYRATPRFLTWIEIKAYLRCQHHLGDHSVIHEGTHGT
jgi:hypothetical protein